MTKIKTRNQCERCKGWFSTRGGNHSRHVKTCNGIDPHHKNRCRHCNLEFNGMAPGMMANHARWCDKNPKKQEYLDRASKLNSFQTPESRGKAGHGVRLAHENGLYDYQETSRKMVETKTVKGNLHPTDETRAKQRETALRSTRRRLRRNTIWYKGVLLDSSWELALAMRLDELGITWIRPDPIKWLDKDGLLRNYFPDFYLPDHDLYLDPKNPFAIVVQKEKISRLLSEHDNLIIIDSIDKCKQFSP